PWLREQPELASSTRGVRARAAAELREDVAHVHVHGSRTEKQIRSDLAVRAPNGDEADDLELPPRESAVVVVSGSALRATAVDGFTELHELPARTSGEWASAELPRRSVRVRQSLDRRFTLTDCRERSTSAKLRLGSFEWKFHVT